MKPVWTWTRNEHCLNLKKIWIEMARDVYAFSLSEQSLNMIWNDISCLWEGCTKFDHNVNKVWKCLNNKWTKYEVEHTLNRVWIMFEQSLNKVWILCSNFVQDHISKEHPEFFTGNCTRNSRPDSQEAGFKWESEQNILHSNAYWGMQHGKLIA